MRTASERDGLELPAVIQRYQAAHDEHDTDRALAAFTSDATVIDEDRKYRGYDEIRHWLSTVAHEFTYTRTQIDAEVIDGDTWLVRNRLEGNFPGGVANLRYRFVLRKGLIAELAIAP
jgi:ketosteroid isomerase-like protein